MFRERPEDRARRLAMMGTMSFYLTGPRSWRRRVLQWWRTRRA